MFMQIFRAPAQPSLPPFMIETEQPAEKEAPVNAKAMQTIIAPPTTGTGRRRLLEQRRRRATRLANRW